MNRGIPVIVICILLILCFALSVAYTSAYRELKLLKVNAEMLADVNSDLISKMGQPDDKILEEKMIKIFGKDALMEIARKQWTYQLFVDGNPFREFYYYPQSENAQLVLIETKVNEKELPLGIHKLGSITQGDQADKFQDHIQIKTTVPYETVMEESELSTTIRFTFKDVPKGTIVNVLLTEALRERIGLEDSSLEIIFK